MEYFSILNFYFLIIVFLALLFPFLFLKFIHPILKRVIEKKNKNLFKNLVKLRFFYTLGYILSPLILLLTLNNTSMIGNDLEKFTYIIKKVSGIWIIVSLSILLNKLLTALNDTFKKNEFFIKYPVNSYLQLIKLIIVIITAIFSICYALNLSPWGILSGVGALGAILLLVFKDTILGLIASIQVYGGKLLQEGDWIELKDLNIDGEVMEVGLHRVKVKAWDNTITTFPTAKFLEYTFKNWRGMQESGGRRIKRRIIFAISYFCNSDDDIPDIVPEIGYLDDAVVARWVWRALGNGWRGRWEVVHGRLAVLPAMVHGQLVATTEAAPTVVAAVSTVCSRCVAADAPISKSTCADRS